MRLDRLSGVELKFGDRLADRIGDLQMFKKGLRDVGARRDEDGGDDRAHGGAGLFGEVEDRVEFLGVALPQKNLR